jgi:hypothetical protein
VERQSGKCPVEGAIFGRRFYDESKMRKKVVIFKISRAAWKAMQNLRGRFTISSMPRVRKSISYFQETVFA